MKTISENKQEKITQLSSFKIDLIGDDKETITPVANVSTNEKDDITSKLRVERTEWTENVKGFSRMFHKTDSLVQLQMDLFSSRQILTERKSTISEIIHKYNKKLKIKRAEETENIEMHSNIKYKNANAFNTVLENRLIDLTDKINIFQIHYDYLSETVNTIDRMIFGVKHRIQIQEMIEQ